jgi:hypothetical protein
MSDRANAGAPALLEGARLGLSRLLALPEGALGAVIARFRASCSSERAAGRGAAAFENRPADIQALAAPLYARGLPVHTASLYTAHGSSPAWTRVRTWRKRSPITSSCA